MATAERSIHPKHLMNRHAKASKIAAKLVEASCLATSLPLSEFFRDVSTESRDIVAAMGIVEPSDACWDMACDIVATAERLAAVRGGSLHGGASGISAPEVK